MKPFHRKKLLVDRQVQWAFLLRAIGYWLMCMCTVMLLLLFTNMLVEPVRLFAPEADGLWLRIGPTVIGAILFLPVVVYDFLRVSNRLVGPLFRLRKAMRALAAGEHVEPLRFRDGDFWREFADEFNAVARLVHVSGGCCASQSVELPAGELVSAGRAD
ncbi:MAG TPA: hypothetical protein VFI31_10290 [Pirellulales bacterium]|nr:hypothetical protein [Pirellulales bacterium]